MFAFVLIVVVTVVSLVVAAVTILVVALSRISRKEPNYEIFDEEVAMDSDQVETQFTPAISVSQRVTDVDIDGQAIQACPWGNLRILQRFTGWSFHTYRCVLKSVPFTVIYGPNDPDLVRDRIHDPFICGGGHHPIVNMFQVYRDIAHLDIAPIAFFLSDPGEISEDRFLVVEAISDRVMDRYAFPSIQSKERLRAFLLDLIRIVDLIECLHGEGYYMNNMHIGSFVYRARDGMLVLWDLSCAKKGTMENMGSTSTMIFVL